MNSQWSDNLRKKMEAHEEPSPKGLWEDIEGILTKDFLVQSEKQPIQSSRQPSLRRKETVQSPNKERNILIWAKWVGAAASLLLLLFLGNLFLQENDLQTPTISEITEVEDNYGSKPIFQQNKEKILFTENKRSNSNSSESYSKKQITATTLLSTEEGTATLIDGKETIMLDNHAQNEQRVETSDIEESNIDSKKGSNEQPKAFDMPVANDTRYPAFTRRKKSATWETSLYASNIPTNSSKEYSGYRSFMVEEISDAKSSISPLFVKQPHEGIVAANKQEVVSSVAKHRQPVTVGASIKYNLNQKWSLTSGLTYTLLSSQIRSGSQHNYYTSDQTLHNIGIPLNINYNLWKSGNMSIYLSAGGALEKNLSGSLHTDYFLNNQFDSNKKEKIKMNRLQWSLNSAIGLEYTLFNNIALYAAPGINYYIENGSTVETIYKEKPVNISLSLGFRFLLGN